MATRLDAALSAAATTLAYTVSAAGNRCLIVGVQTEGTQSGNFTCDYGGQAMQFLVQQIAGTGTTQQTVGLFFLNDAGITAAGTNVITPGNTGTPGDLTIHARSYQDCVQTTPTNTDSDTAEDATTPLANCDIITAGANAIVASIGGMGNAGSAAWAAPVTEQTDQADASSQGSFADDEVPSATTIALELTWTTPNRSAIVAVGIESVAAGASISAVTPSEFDFDNTDVDITGSGFEGTQNTGQVWISDASTLAGSVNEVEIDGAINTWADGTVNLNFSGMSQAEIDNLHTLGPGAIRWIILENDSSEETSFQITLHRPQAFEMVAGLLVPGVTTARLTGMTGTFGGGRAEETAAQNPSTTDTDIANDGNREDLFSIQAKPNSVDGDTYDFKILYDGNDPDTITQIPQVTISIGAEGDINATPDLAFSVSSADLKGDGKLDASSNLAFTILIADLEGLGKLDATLDMAFALASADLEATGKLDATPAFVFTIPSADLKALGKLDATPAMIFAAATADLKGLGKLDSTPTLVFTVPIADLVNSAGEIDASPTLIFTVPIADLEGRGKLDASASLVFTMPSSDLKGDGKLDASATMIFAIPNTDLKATGKLDATATLIFSISSAKLRDSSIVGPIDASPEMLFSVTADLEGAGKLDASVDIVFTIPSADLNARGLLSSTSALTLSVPNSNLIGIGKLDSSVALIFASPITTLIANGQLSANASMIFSASTVDLKAKGLLTTSPIMVFSANANLIGKGSLAASLTPAFSLTANLIDIALQAPFIHIDIISAALKSTITGVPLRDTLVTSVAGRLN